MEIKGTLEYTINLSDKGVGIDYETSMESNLVALFIAGNTAEQGALNWAEHKKTLKGEAKKKAHEAQQRMIRAKYVLDNMCRDLAEVIMIEKQQQTQPENVNTNEQSNS